MNELALYRQAEQLLVRIASMEDADDLMRMAEAARVFAERERLGIEMVNYATAIKLKAGRRLSEIYDARPKPQGGRGKTRPAPGQVSRQRLSELRRIAKVLPDDDAVDREVAMSNKAGKQVSVTRLIAAWRVANPRPKKAKPQAQPQQPEQMVIAAAAPARWAPKVEQGTVMTHDGTAGSQARRFLSTLTSSHSDLHRHTPELVAAAVAEWNRGERAWALSCAEEVVRVMDLFKAEIRRTDVTDEQAAPAASQGPQQPNQQQPEAPAHVRPPDSPSTAYVREVVNDDVRSPE